MQEILSLASNLLEILKPLIAPSEHERWAKEFWRIKELNDERWKKIKAALAAGDIPALNIILAELLELQD